MHVTFLKSWLGTFFPSECFQFRGLLHKATCDCDLWSNFCTGDLLIRLELWFKYVALNSSVKYGIEKSRRSLTSAEIITLQLDQVLRLVCFLYSVHNTFLVPFPCLFTDSFCALSQNLSSYSTQWSLKGYEVEFELQKTQWSLKDVKSNLLFQVHLWFFFTEFTNRLLIAMIRIWKYLMTA